MNKAFCKKRVFLSFLLTGCLILFNLSCGLDTFYVIDAPHQVLHQPVYSYSKANGSDAYFEFWTVDKDYDSIKFLGTDVYYKIYKSSNQLVTETDYLTTIATNEDTMATSADKLITSYKYQKLFAVEAQGKKALFESVRSNQRIKIRLNDYTDEYLAEITVDGMPLYSSSSRVIPLRYLKESNTTSTRAYSFNFTDANEIPKDSTTEFDVNFSGSGTTDDCWYVAMFAVAVGLDYTYANVYSNILYLGSVPIFTD